MGRVHRYRTALSRHHRSAGFGIHSPFAFAFVLDVLRERLPYYGYDYIIQLRQAVKAIKCSREQLISGKNAKMLFRIANYFNPKHILVIGTRDGLSVASVKIVSSQSHLYLYEPRFSQESIAAKVLEAFIGSVNSFDSLSAALSSYQSAVDDSEENFILIHDIPHDDDFKGIKDFLGEVINHSGVVVMTNLDQSKAMRQLWQSCEQQMRYGQSFTNEKLGIVVANPKLNVEHFFLWF